jgi:hypothetical protein
MWGAAEHDRSEGVHRPLTATAMVFAPSAEAGNGGNPNEQLVLVAIDHCLLFPDAMQALTDSVCQRASIDWAQLLVTFSHTHGAGLMDPGRAELPGGDLIAPYLASVAESVADAVQEARASVAPAAITYSSGRCNLAADRDYYDAERQLYVCGLNPLEPADDTLLVARVTRAGGTLAATIVNYACHPTTLSFENRLISPDYPGALRELVEQATGAPCVFLLGASGDLGPRDGYVGGTALADRNGRQVGHAALGVLEGMSPPLTAQVYQGPVISGATLGIWRHEPLDDAERMAASRWSLDQFTIDLPYRADLPDLDETRRQHQEWLAKEQAARDAGRSADATDARAMVERMARRLTRLSVLPRGECFPYPVALWKMGDAVWLAVDGEPYNLLQRELRERIAPVPLVVIVLTGGSRAWYLPTADAYGKGIYQETVAVLAPGSLEMLIDELAQRLEALVK